MKLLRRMNKSNNRKNSGFTLVELVIVMAIMGMVLESGRSMVRIRLVASIPSITGMRISMSTAS